MVNEISNEISDRVSKKEWKSDRFAQVVGKDYIT